MDSPPPPTLGRHIVLVSRASLVTTCVFVLIFYIVYPEDAEFVGGRSRTQMILVLCGASAGFTAFLLGLSIVGSWVGSRILRNLRRLAYARLLALPQVPPPPFQNARELEERIALYGKSISAKALVVMLAPMAPGACLIVFVVGWGDWLDQQPAILQFVFALLLLASLSPIWAIFRHERRWMQPFGLLCPGCGSKLDHRSVRRTGKCPLCGMAIVADMQQD